MQKLINKFSYFPLKHSVFVISAAILVTLASISVIPLIKMDNSVDAFFNKKSAHYINFQEWKKEFGSDEVVVVAFSDADIFTRDNLKLIEALTGKLESLKYVDKVTSLSSVNDIIGSENDFNVKKLIEEVPESRQELDDLRARALSNPLYLKNIISSDGKSTALIIELEPRKGASDAYKKEVITGIQNTLKEDDFKSKKFYLSGSSAIEYFYANYMQEDLKTFMPLILLIIVIVLMISFRGIIGFLLPFITVIMSLIWTMGFLYVCGYSINNVTTIIPPIMLSIALLENIHFVWELIARKKSADPKGQAVLIIAETTQHLFVPCFLTNITTSIGFFAVMATTVPPIQQMGWVVGVGVFFAFVLTFTFLPAAIKQFGLLKYLSTKAVDNRLKNKTDELLLGLTKFSDKFKYPILAVTGVLIILSVWQVTRIKTETSVLEYFRKDSPVYIATKYIEDNLTGVHFVNVSLKAADKDFFVSPDQLRKIQELQEFLKSMPEVDKTISVVDYLKEINKSFHGEDPRFYSIPESRKLIAQYILLYGADDLNDYVDSKWSWTTVRIRLKEHSTAKLKKIMARIQDHLNKEFAAPVKPELVGQTVLEVDANEAVTSGQVQSLALAMILIFGMMFIDFRSISLGLVSMAPNVFPLLLNFGIMGLLAIRLDSATSIVADIGLGIIVDDTIHFFHSFGENYRKSNDYHKAMFESFVTKGSPTLITSIILILGFGVVATSKFVPTYYFGLLSAILIFNGLWSEFLLCPALLMLVKPKFPMKKNQ